MSKFQDNLKMKMREYVKLVYKHTKSFPKSELYGVTSQLQRAALSVILNFIEGYARFKPKVKQQFYETSYGSLKESKYLIYFCFTENYLSKEVYSSLNIQADEIGRMLWSEIIFIKNKSAAVL